MTDIFYDLEFLDDGQRIHPISIGMVAENGSEENELYAVFEEIETPELYTMIKRHGWLMENVVPHLPLHTDRGRAFRHPSSADGGMFMLDPSNNQIMPTRMIRNAVRDFILSQPGPRLWAWYGAYDHVALAQLFGPMSRLPKGIPMFTCDIRQEFERYGNPTYPEATSASEHHALADARENQLRLRWLREVIAGNARPLW